MADIELVIKIPEEVYKASQIIDVKYEDTVQIPLEVITNSTPLPKRLVDADKFINSLKGIERLHIDDELRNNIFNAVYTNIIEADKVESENKE